MKIKRFKNIHNLQDIKLEKAKLRYEMLAAENKMLGNIDALSETFSLNSIISSFNKGLNTALSVYSTITNIFSSKRKSRKKENN